jgi:Tfp pilus assembly protein PilF
VATTLQQRAAIARARGELEEAEEAYRRCVELRRELLGATSPDLAMALDLFGWFLIERKRIDEAGPLLQEALAIRRSRLDEGHPLLGWSLNNLGVWHYWRRELAAAEERIGEAVAQARAHDGTGNAGFPVWLGNLGAVKLAQRDFAAAEPQLLEAHRLLLALRGPRHPQTASVVASLVTLFNSLGQPQRAAEYSSQLPAAPAGATH